MDQPELFDGHPAPIQPDPPCDDCSAKDERIAELAEQVQVLEAENDRLRNQRSILEALATSD